MSLPIQDNSIARGKFTLCEFGRRAIVLLTCGALLTEARDQEQPNENIVQSHLINVALLNVF